MVFFCPARRSFSDILSPLTQRCLSSVFCTLPGIQQSNSASLSWKDHISPSDISIQVPQNQPIFPLNIEFSFFVCGFTPLSTYSTYSLVHYLHHLFSTYLFSHFSLMPVFPKDKMSITNVNKHRQPYWRVAFTVFKFNVPSALQNSHQGCKPDISVENEYLTGESCDWT